MDAFLALFVFEKSNDMKIAIIGAGNMGGAIARGLAQSRLSSASATSFASSAAGGSCAVEGSAAFYELVVANPSRQKLETLQAEYPMIQITQSNVEAVRGADLVLLAVKPWKMEIVAHELMPVLDYRTQMVASVAGGMGLSDLSALFRHNDLLPPLFYVMPNTAVAVRQSMTFVAAQGASEEQTAAVVNLFRLLGEAMLVEERLMDGGMALASCGIAFAMRYIRAAMEGGVELGFYPDEAKQIVMQTLSGAVELLRSTGNHPEAEIDRVTTPGGITIRGLNEMEHAGFTDSVIRGLRAARPVK